MENMEEVMEGATRKPKNTLTIRGLDDATIERLKAFSSRTRILVLTTNDDPAELKVTLAAGADGYILKTEPTETVVAAIHGVLAGLKVVSAHFNDVKPENPDPRIPVELSSREREVLALLAKGHTHQEIADILFVSVKTVETYRARVREKTGLKTRADFVRYGQETGLSNTPK